MPKVSPERLEATRRRVLDGARRAFAAYGYEGATVRRLEEETGLSRGAIFHHFADKDALFLALAQEDAEEVATLVDDFGLVGAMHKLRDKDAGWLGVQLEVGLDYQVTRSLALGAAYHEHFMLTDMATYPVFFNVLARVEYVWGW